MLINQARSQQLKSQIELLRHHAITRMTDRVTAQVTIDAALGSTPTTWDIAWNYHPNPANITQHATFNSTLIQQVFDTPIALATTELRIFITGAAPDGLITTLDSIPQPGGLDAYQFRAAKVRLTLPDTWVGPARPSRWWWCKPPGIQRLLDGERTCRYNGVATSCLDLRRSSIYPALDYFWDDAAREKTVQQWDLPDVHITGAVALVMYSQPGRMDIYSSDHPADSAPAAAQSFSFNAWGARVQVTEETCEAGGALTIVVRGIPPSACR